MIVTMMPVMERGELCLIHLGGEIRVNWERKYQENIKKYVLDWDNGTGNCVDENGIPS